MKFHVPHIPFMRYSRHGIIFSALLTAAALLLIFIRGFNFGLEFTGGATLEFQFQKALEIAEIREQVQEVNPRANVVQFGSSREIQISFGEVQGQSIDDLMQATTAHVQALHPDATLTRQAKVSGQYREELIEKGLTALLLSCLGMVAYLSLRFEWKFAIGAVIGQLHDVIIVAAVFALTQWTFDLNVLAALLAVLGYSVNDTVVLYDRIRENLKKLPNVTPADIIDISIRQTMMRTFVTSFTTILSVLALLFFGGETLFGFAAAMVVGIIFGTYSSVFVSTAIVNNMRVRAEDLLPKAKTQVDDLP